MRRHLASWSLAVAALMAVATLPRPAAAQADGGLIFAAEDGSFAGVAERFGSVTAGVMLGPGGLIDQFLGEDVLTLTCVDFATERDGTLSMYATYVRLGTAPGVGIVKYVRITGLLEGAFRGEGGFSSSRTSVDRCGAGGVSELGPVLGFKHEHIDIQY